MIRRESLNEALAPGETVFVFAGKKRTGNPALSQTTAEEMLDPGVYIDLEA